MMRPILRATLVLGLFGVCLRQGATAFADELKGENIRNVKGDGPDGKGNSEDDTWQFWFELAHAPGKFERLSTATANLTAQQRKDGIRKKVRGPIAGLLPNPDDTEGWIFHRDWDGRFEGVWSDRKTGAILVHPYAEKTAHCAAAITYRVPRRGTYTVSGKLTDVAVREGAPHDGFLWRVEQVAGGKTIKVLSKGGPIGDGQGRPESATFEAVKVELNSGDLVRLVIHPHRWWGGDLTRIDRFRIEAVQE